MFWTPDTVADISHLHCCYCYDDILLAVERKGGHLDLWGPAPRGGREPNDIPGQLSAPGILEKSGEEEENTPCPPPAFGVNGGDCCRMMGTVCSS